MDLTTLTHPSAVCVQARYTSRDEAIRQLTQRLVALGKIADGETFLTDVFHRESLGPTALGEGLAVPHGKSGAVKDAAFAVATLREPLAWEGVDGPENVELIVLLAIPPAEAGSTHIQVLTELTSRLADDALRARVMAATTAEALLAALNDAPRDEDVIASEDAPTVVCVTACPAGIAHTYMAAEYLEKAGRKLGVNVVVEKQGANGIEGRLIGSFVLGSMATGAIVGAMGIGLSTPGAGIFSLFLLHDAGLGGVVAAAGWFSAALAGTTLSTLVLLFWRRQAVRKGKYMTEDVTP